MNMDYFKLLHSLQHSSPQDSISYDRSLIFTPSQSRYLFTSPIHFTLINQNDDTATSCREGALFPVWEILRL